MMKKGREYGPEILERVFSREDGIWRAANDIISVYKSFRGTGK